MPPRRARASAAQPATAPSSRAGTGARSALFPSGRAPEIALVMVVGAGALAGGVASGRPALAAAILVVQLVLGLCWLTLLRASLATGALVGLAALAYDSLLLRSGRADAGSMAGVIGLAVLAAIGSQLLRRDRRDVTAGIAAALSGVVLVAAAALLLPMRQFDQGRGVALTGLVAVAVGLAAARIVPGPGLPVRGGAFVVAVAVGTWFGAAAQELWVVTALLTTALATLAALVVDLGVLRMSSGVGPRQLPALRPVAGLLPLVAAQPVVYVAAWIVGARGVA